MLRYTTVCAGLAIALIVAPAAFGQTAARPITWPTSGWPTDTAAAAGLSAERPVERYAETAT